jgi:hypothetical protein
LRFAACDLRSGSGLTANRKNLPYASELYPAFDFLLVLLDQRFAIRPLLALPAHFHERVTALESRARHQPEKLWKMSKNDSVFTLFILAVNEKFAFATRVFSVECMPSTSR